MSQSLLAEALKCPSVDSRSIDHHHDDVSSSQTHGNDLNNSLDDDNDYEDDNIVHCYNNHNNSRSRETVFGHQSMSSISSSVETRKTAPARSAVEAAADEAAGRTGTGLLPTNGNNSNYQYHYDHDDGNDIDNHSAMISVSSSLASSDRFGDQDREANNDFPLPLHSDFTVPTSNQQQVQLQQHHQQQQQLFVTNQKNATEQRMLQPPLSVVASGGTIKHRNGHNHDVDRSSSRIRTNGQRSNNRNKNNSCRGKNNGITGDDGRRSIMTSIVGKKYGALNSKRNASKQQPISSARINNTDDELPLLLGDHDPITPPESPILSHQLHYKHPLPPTLDHVEHYDLSPIPIFDSHSAKMSTTANEAAGGTQLNDFKATKRSCATLLHNAVTPPIQNDGLAYHNGAMDDEEQTTDEYERSTSHSCMYGQMTPLSPSSVSSPSRSWNRNSTSHNNSLLQNPQISHEGRGTAVHETMHAQSLLLGLAFMAVWTPNNALAPNLTQMAYDTFDMNEAARDLYLGSYCALAVGVFSIPLSGVIGFMADFHSRKDLFLACVLLGSLSSAWTGWSQNFWSLFLARLISGGCMSGSVPVAFSLLGDLFSTEERNAASSGLTAMMGLGILAGQVYAGVTGPRRGWQDVFYCSATLQLVAAAVIGLWVKEPVRGAKERALQNVFESGNKYERKLTLKGFLHALHRNESNRIIMWQGFLTSLPWGIIFVFLNDYLSQEKGFSVPEATFIIMLFGVGCALGGIVGGYFGAICMKRNRSFLPLYMAAGTFFGIFPFLFLFNSEFPNHHGAKANIIAIIGGFICCLPSVNVRPIIINVNPPETRGAALTAANLLVTLGRGLGPLCIVFMGSVLNASRQASLNITVSGFWAISAIQLLFMMKTFPRDQDAMEEELVRYARASASNADHRTGIHGTRGALLPISPSSREDNETSGLLSRIDDSHIHDDGESIVSIEDYMTSFDGTAARRSLQFVRMGIKELQEEITSMAHPCHGCEGSPSDDESEILGTSDHIYLDDHGETKMDDSAVEDDTDLTESEIHHRRELWLRQQEDQNR